MIAAALCMVLEMLVLLAAPVNGGLTLLEVAEHILAERPGA